MSVWVYMQTFLGRVSIIFRSQKCLMVYLTTRFNFPLSYCCSFTQLTWIWPDFQYTTSQYWPKSQWILVLNFLTIAISSGYHKWQMTHQGQWEVFSSMFLFWADCKEAMNLKFKPLVYTSSVIYWFCIQTDAQQEIT